VELAEGAVEQRDVHPRWRSKRLQVLKVWWIPSRATSMRPQI
jgi:hypothetical protein